MPERDGGTDNKAALSLTARIENLAYRASFDPQKLEGTVPVSVSVFRSGDFIRAATVLRKAFRTAYCLSDLVAVAGEGEELGGVTIPAGATGLATVSNMLLKGVLLKAGIPAQPKFAGILEVKKRRAARFVDLIEYAGSSLDPVEMFIAGKMTSVGDCIETGTGKVMASFWEVPAPAKADVEMAVEGLRRWRVKGMIVVGMVSAPLCEMPVAVYRFGVVVVDGLNAVAAAAEAGIESVNHTMSGMIDSARLRSFARFKEI